MKRGLIIVILLFSIVFIAACTNTTVKNTVCGDNTCDPTESCLCSDCAKTEYCIQKNATETCNDQNSCTTDYFNTTLNECIYNKIPNCCGNGICENNERICDYSKFETGCVKDCGVQCPEKLIVHKDINSKVLNEISYSCNDNNCTEIGSNKFNLTGTSSIVTYVSNIGEKASGAVTGNFICYDIYDSDIASDNGDKYLGIVFNNYFNSNEEYVSVNSRISGNNTAVYYLKLNIPSGLINKFVRCSVTLSSSNLQSFQQVEFNINS